LLHLTIVHEKYSFFFAAQEKIYIKDHQNLKEIEILFGFTKETRTIYVHIIVKGLDFIFDKVVRQMKTF
jgi:hypothetical protein